MSKTPQRPATVRRGAGDAPEVPQGSPNLTQTTMSRLRRFNLYMALLHTGQALLMIWLSSGFALPVTTSFLYFDQASRSLRPRPETLYDLRIGPAVAAFLLISALAHLALASPLLYPRYSQWAAKGVNPVRWVEYSLSSSLMIALIAMLVGIYDLAALIAIFGVNACMILFGWAMEHYNQGDARPDWLAYWFGVFAGAVPWIAIGIYLFGAGVASASPPPAFVYAIYGSLFVFFNVFALNMVLQYRGTGPWRRPMFSERVYMILSLAAKSALAWQVFAGTLRPM